MVVKDYIVKDNISVKKSLEILNNLEKQILFIVDHKGTLIGTLTDGDIRRGLLKGLSLDNKLCDFINENFKYFKDIEFDYEKLNFFKKEGIEILPILNSKGKIENLIDLSKKKSILPLTAIIMAGGLGSRLKPLTNKCPKPMLKIGSKPILEHIIDRLVEYGINKIFISVNYLSDQIISYFGDGSSKGVNIEYIKEEKPLGTIGSASLIQDKIDFSKNILIMNSDVLTNINFQIMYEEFKNKKSDMIVASVPYNVNIPYAILETKKDLILRLSEKPKINYQTNAGIYLFRSEYLNKLKKNHFFNATDFCEILIKESRKINIFPILGYWKDIGSHKDLTQAEIDIKQISF